MTSLESVEKAKKVGFLLAFEIYSYGSIDWSNPPIPKEYPFLSVELLETFFYKCVDQQLLDFIVLPADKSVITGSLLKKKRTPSVYTNKDMIKNRVAYFIQQILSKRGAIIGTEGDVTTFLKLFRSLYWAINAIAVEDANHQINELFDEQTLAAVYPLPCKNLFFINKDCDPIYLLQNVDVSRTV